MAILRLTNGGDVTVDLSVEDALAAIAIVTGGAEFVELPGKEGGPIHVRPSSVIAVLDSVGPKTSGFRPGAASGFSR